MPATHELYTGQEIVGPYDPKCLELALYFLKGHSVTVLDVHHFAEALQEVCERYGKPRDPVDDAEFGMKP